MINYDDMDRGDLVLTVHDQLVVQEPIGQASTKIQQAMEASYQDILRYQVIADPEYGMNFGEMSAEPENISHFIGKS
jgi:hypothetical protein